MKQHERTHRNNRDNASISSVTKETEAITKRTKTVSPQATVSPQSTVSSTEMEVDSTPSDDGQATIKAKPVAPRRPALSTMQPGPQVTLSGQADVIMPVTLESNEQLEPVAPELTLEPIEKNYAAISGASFVTRSQENIFGRPPMLDRTTSTGSGFGSQDGEGESPGLDALAMAASMS